MQPFHDGFRRLNNSLLSLICAARALMYSRTEPSTADAALARFAAEISKFNAIDLTPVSDSMREELLAAVGTLRSLQNRVRFIIRHPRSVQVFPPVDADEEQRVIATVLRVQRYCSEMARRTPAAEQTAEAMMAGKGNNDDSTMTPQKFLSPESPDLQEFIKALKRAKPRKGKEAEFSRKWCLENDLTPERASTILRQARNYRHLWQSADAR